MAEQERLDGVVVEVRSGVFAGGFDFNWDDVDALGYDRTMVIVAVVHSQAPTFRPTPQGTLRRVDKLAVQEVRVAVGERGIELAEVFDMDYQGNLALSDPLEITAGGEAPDEPEPDEPDAPEEPPEPPAKAKRTTKKAEPERIVTPPSSLIGQHVGGSMAHDPRLAALLEEPADQLVHGGRH
jgi:pyruvate/2-oxoglutarate dehydrogenase complex dihydrolipoamide acyltransferase (E2) component